MKEDIIRLSNVNKYFDALHVLRNVSLGIKQNEAVAIIGASGSGKSTLLRCINGLEAIKSGKIYVDGIPMHLKGKEQNEMRKRIGMVFQGFNLFPHYSVLDNIAKPMTIVNKVNYDHAKGYASELLKKVKLEDKKDSYPSQLSGGQKQRVAIARALAMNPEIMLFDEPTSALDPELVGEVLEVIKELAREGMTMLIVSHEMSFVRDISDKLIFMEKGEIYEEGKPEDIFSSRAKERTREFIGKIRI